MVKFLVFKGANIHAIDDYAVYWASRNGHLSVVRFLTSEGANIHANGDYALRRASKNSRLL